jgi:hypothetical protein
MVKQVSDQLRDLLKNHLRRLLSLANYHRRMYHLSSGKVQRILKGDAKSSNRPARSLASYDPEFLNFLKEAADSHEHLKFFKGFSVLDHKSHLYGMSTPITISQFLLCYSAVHQRFNPENRQFIQPNEQMLRHLGAGVKEALAKQAMTIPELSSRYAGQLRFPFVQTLISRYRRAPTTEEGRAELRKFSNDVQVVATLKRENETLTSARARIWEDVRKNNPPRPKPPGKTKMTKARKTARNAKKAVNALAAVSHTVLP